MKNFIGKDTTKAILRLVNSLLSTKQDALDELTAEETQELWDNIGKEEVTPPVVEPEPPIELQKDIYDGETTFTKTLPSSVLASGDSITINSLLDDVTATIISMDAQPNDGGLSFNDTSISIGKNINPGRYNITLGISSEVYEDFTITLTLTIERGTLTDNIV